MPTPREPITAAWLNNLLSSLASFVFVCGVQPPNHPRSTQHNLAACLAPIPRTPASARTTTPPAARPLTHPHPKYAILNAHPSSHAAHSYMQTPALQFLRCDKTGITVGY